MRHRPNFRVPFAICLFPPKLLCPQTIPKEGLVFLTCGWKGERFDGGRPKLPDHLLERAKKIGIGDAWAVLGNQGHSDRFEGDRKMARDEVPVAGRALTALFMPGRHDLEKNVPNSAKGTGNRQIEYWAS